MAVKELVWQNWLYHCFHLADNNIDCKDCLICKWYRELKETTKRLNTPKERM